MFAGCEETPVQSAEPLSDHAWMADTLETLYQNANPEDVYSLNTRRANVQAEQVYPNAPAGQQARALFLRAEELLNSGKTKPAIEQLQVLIRSLGGENPVISTHNHRIFQRIALAFLRLGEQQNCQINHSAESCVLPLTLFLLQDIGV